MRYLRETSRRIALLGAMVAAARAQDERLRHASDADVREAIRAHGGGGAAGAAAQQGARRSRGSWDPSEDPVSLLWWDPTTLTDGAVSSWTDGIASVGATQATGTAQPTKSDTAIGGAYPGVTSDGGDTLIASGAGAVLSGKTTLTTVCAMVDATGTVGVALEHTAHSATTDGGFAVVANGSTLSVNGATRGASGDTNRAASETLATVAIVSVGHDFATAGAGAVPFIRVNGVSQSLDNVRTGSTAGSAANAALHLFARSGLVAPWPGTFGDIVIRESIAQDADLAKVESFIANRVGVTL